LGEREYNREAAQQKRKRMNVMSDNALKAQEEMLFLEVSDEMLEVAAGAVKVHASFTLGSCTGLSECPG
jgi:hypothetical protein